MRSILLGLAAMAAMFWPAAANAETTECTVLTALPATITVQGVYCLKSNLVTGSTSGNAITINTNNVTIDLNGFKLGGQAAGPGTGARGIYADGRTNITIRNGSIRGFNSGIFFQGPSSSGHLIEDIRADGNTYIGIVIEGDNHIVRNNHIVNTGPGSTSTNAFGIAATNARNVTITGNVVSGVSEMGTVFGIYAGSVSNGTISDNVIYDLDTAASKYGIYFTNSSGIQIVGNQLSNGTTATTGIFDSGSSTGIDCIGNIIRGYSTGTSGCDYISGNHIN